MVYFRRKKTTAVHTRFLLPDALIKYHKILLSYCLLGCFRCVVTAGVVQLDQCPDVLVPFLGWMCHYCLS